MSRESAIERAICQKLFDEFGCWSVKMGVVHVSGFPDRLILLPDGRCLFLEIKQPDGRVAAIQDFQLGRLREMGFVAEVVRSVEEAVSVVQGYIDDPDGFRTLSADPWGSDFARRQQSAAGPTP